MGNEEISQTAFDQQIQTNIAPEPPFCEVELLQTAKAIKITSPNNHQQENFLTEIYNRNKNSVSQANPAPKEPHAHRGSLDIGHKSRNKFAIAASLQLEINEPDKENRGEKTPQRSKRSYANFYQCTIEDCESVSAK